MQPPVVRLCCIWDIKIGLNRFVITHFPAPEYLFTKTHFPASRQRAVALNLIRGDDFVPTVFRIAEHDRLCIFQIIQLLPMLANLLHALAGRNLCNFRRQTSKNIRISGIDCQILILRSSSHNSASCLFKFTIAFFFVIHIY